MLIRAHGKGIIATTLNFDYEVRSSKEAFEDVAKVKIEAEMLDLATRRPRLRNQPKSDDEQKSNVVNIMDALKKSVAKELKSRKAG